MNHSPKFYPWFLFNKIFKIFLQTCLLFILLLTAYTLSTLDLLEEIFWIASSLICFIFFNFKLYFSLKPLSSINKRIARIEEQLPHEQRLRLFYKKDDWSHLESAIALAQEQIEGQGKLIKSESNKNTLLLESISDGILAVDLEETLLFLNSPFAKTFLNVPIESQGKAKIWSLISDQEVLDKYKATLKLKCMHTIKSYAHHKQFFDVTIVPIISDGETIGAVGVFHDITERKLTDQMRVDFVANISHEIRTPLTSIQGYSQLLASTDESQTPQTKLYVDKIIKNSERMIALFSDLLQLSVIESNNKVAIEEIDFKALCEHVVTNIKTMYPAKNLELNFDIKENKIYVDEKLFERVITNLIDNACKYTDQSPHLTISCQLENNQYIIKISDQGPGIEEEHLKRIFERFYRVEKSRDTTTGGTGLGLAIVKHIIQKHSGDISVQSSKNNGTTFTIVLPKLK